MGMGWRGSRDIDFAYVQEKVRKKAFAWCVCVCLFLFSFAWGGFMNGTTDCWYQTEDSGALCSQSVWVFFGDDLRNSVGRISERFVVMGIRFECLTCPIKFYRRLNKIEVQCKVKQKLDTFSLGII